ncbi:MAG: fibronectin type III domain-containing protein [Chloroflexi bacterium]|nr:fibronectin type III domain-containing protein [Chloroflexota bacterium]
MSRALGLAAWLVVASCAWLALAPSAAAEGDDTDSEEPPTPARVEHLEVITGSPDALTLRWPRPADNGEPITGFDIQRSDNREQWADLALEYPVAAYRDRSLNQGQRYWYRVRAVSAVGQGPWSIPAMGAPAVPPGVITDLTVTNLSDESLTVAWSAPEANGSPVVRYELERLFGADHGQVVDFWAFTEWPREHTTFAFAIPNPLEGPGRAYRIRSWNLAGESGWSEPVLADTSATTPARSPSLTIVGIGPREIRLDWSAPEPNGSDIFAHQVGRRHAIDHLLGYDHWSEAAWVADKSWTTIETVFHGTPRTFRVRSWNNVGEGAWSPWAGITWGLITASGSHEEFRGMFQAQCPGGFEVHAWADALGGVFVPYSIAADGTAGRSNPVLEALFPDGFDVTPLFVSHCHRQTYFEEAVRSSGLALTIYTGGVARLYHALETECAPGAVAYANASRGDGGSLVAFSPSFDDAGNTAFEERFRFDRLWDEPLLITGCGP